MKKIKFLILIIGMVFALIPAMLNAVPANPTSFILEQPDGSKFKARQVGDERSAWIETLEGYSITQNLHGEWVYAEEGRLSQSEAMEIITSGKFRGLSGTHILRPTNKIVGKDLPKGLERHIRPVLEEKVIPKKSEGKILEEKEIFTEKSFPLYQSAQSQGSPSYSPGTTETEYVVVIPIQFTDVTFSSGYDQAYYENLIFNENNPGSMNSYFEEVSYGQLNVTGIVASVVTSSRTMKYYGADKCSGIDTGKQPNCVDIYELAREAVQLADSSTDFSQYDKDSNGVVDHITIVHAGNGQESSGVGNDIWSHAWYIDACYDPGGSVCGEQVDGVEVERYIMLAEDSPVGTFAHEFGHDLGLPDLYNTATGGTVVGYWDLMDSGSWNGAPAGTSPAHISAWGKDQLDWLTPAMVNGLISTNIDQIETNQEAYWLYDYQLFSVNEYFLVENRQLTGFDSYLPRSGILIWHIDNKQGNNNGAIKRVMPELAGGSLSTAPFASDYGYTSFTSTTTPNTDTNSNDETTVYAVDIGSSSSSMAATLFGGIAKLESYLITGSKNVTQNEFFTFESGVRCVGGDCGNVSATLDPEIELAYDDGTPDVFNPPASKYLGWGSSGGGFAVRFTPLSYPVKIKTARFYVSDTTPFELHVWSDNSQPDSDLITPFQVNPDVSENWYDIDLSSYNIEITSGDFYIGWIELSSTNYVGTDTTPPHDDRSWVYDGSSWDLLSSYDAPYDTVDMMIRAVVEGTGKGTIPMNSGTPFYTTSPNPQNSSNLACLEDMQDQDTCEQTWQVNATGEIDTSYDFFTIYDSITYGNIETNRTNKVNITIVETIIDQLPTLWCSFHNIHTIYSDGSMTPEQRLASAKANFDCASTNDHDTQLNQIEWNLTINEADSNNLDNDFTYFFGIEWTGYQHMHYIINGPAPQTQRDALDSGLDEVSELTTFLSENNGIAQHNHPARTSGGTDFSNPANYNETLIPLVEMVNKEQYHWNYWWNCSANSGCTTYQNPESPGQSESGTGWIKYALDQGIHLGFSGGDDYHGPNSSYAPTTYTGIVNPINWTREGVYQELKKRHTWAAEDKILMNVIANNGSNNFIMGDIFNTKLSNLYINYSIKATAGKNIVNVSLFFDGVIINLTQFSNQQNVTGYFDVIFSDNNEHYLFVEAIQNDGKRAWSSPMYITYAPAAEIISITLYGFPIEFGNIDPGKLDNNATGNANGSYKIRVNPETNVNVSLYQKGNDYNTTGGYILGIGNMTWNKINNVTTSLATTKTYSSVETNVAPDTNITMYYWVDLPVWQRAGNYNSTIYIKAETGTLPE